MRAGVLPLSLPWLERQASLVHANGDNVVSNVHYQPLGLAFPSCNCGNIVAIRAREAGTRDRDVDHLGGRMDGRRMRRNFVAGLIEGLQVVWPILSGLI